MSKLSKNNSRSKPKPNRLQEQLAQVQAATGENVNVVAPDAVWAMRLGVLVDLDICRWRGQSALTLEDLGLGVQANTPAYQALKATMALGAKKFFPPEIASKLSSIESSARNVVADYANKTRWGDWIDLGVYAKFKQLIEAKQKEYMALGHEITNGRWDEIQDWNKSQYAENARAAYDRLDSLQASILIDPETHKKISLDAFVDAYVERVMTHIPSANEVRQSFDFRVQLSFIPLPSILANDIAEKERVLSQRALEAQAAQAKQQILAERAKTVSTKEQAKREIIDAKKKEKVTKEQSQRTIAELEAENLRLELEMRKKQLDEMTQDVLGIAQGQGQQMANDFTREIARNAIERVVKNLREAKESIDKNNALVGKVADGLRNTVTSYQALVVKSNALDTDIERLRVLLARVSSERSIGETIQLIDRIMQSAKHALKALTA